MLKILALTLNSFLAVFAFPVYAQDSYIHEPQTHFGVLFGSLLVAFFWLLFKFSKEKRELKATLESLPDLLFKFDVDGNYLDVYTDRPRKLASPVDDLIGKNVKDILSVEAANTVLESLSAAAKVGFDFGRTIKLAVPEGDRYFELSVSRKKDAANNSIFFSMISRDITDRINYEKEI